MNLYECPHCETIQVSVICGREVEQEVEFTWRCPECKERRCSSCPSFTCDGCQKRHCFKHLVIDLSDKYCGACHRESMRVLAEESTESLRDAA